MLLQDDAEVDTGFLLYGAGDSQMVLYRVLEAIPERFLIPHPIQTILRNFGQKNALISH